MYYTLLRLAGRRRSHPRGMVRMHCPRVATSGLHKEKSTSYTSPDVVHKFFGRFNFARKKAILKTLLTALKRSLSNHIDIDLILRLKGLLLLLLHIAASNSGA